MNEFYSYHFMLATIDIIRDQIKDMWSWSAYNKDRFNSEIDEIETILNKMREELTK